MNQPLTDRLNTMISEQTDDAVSLLHINTTQLETTVHRTVVKTLAWLTAFLEANPSVESRIFLRILLEEIENGQSSVLTETDEAECRG